MSTLSPRTPPTATSAKTHSIPTTTIKLANANAPSTPTAKSITLQIHSGFGQAILLVIVDATSSLDVTEELPSSTQKYADASAKTNAVPLELLSALRHANVSPHALLQLLVVVEMSGLMMLTANAFQDVFPSLPVNSEAGTTGPASVNAQLQLPV